jgi:hypothetical protein
MRRRKPLIDESGEVRELLMEDVKRFQPAPEALSPSLLAKLGIETRQEAPPADEALSLVRNQTHARKVAAEHTLFAAASFADCSCRHP